jgi:hypothetical protein
MIQYYYKMPKQVIDYSNTIIYKLCCKDPTITDIYIGHTTNFVKRKQQHKNFCNAINGTAINIKRYNSNVYQFIRKNGNWDNWSMIEICHINCVDKRDAEKQERHYIETLMATLNKVIPTRTGKEYREEHKEQIRKYREEHKEENAIMYKKYREEHKEQIRKYREEYSEDHKEQIRKYREEHKEEKAIMDKKYREENREKIFLAKQKYREEHKEQIRLKKQKYREEYKEEINSKKREEYKYKKVEICL